MEGPQLPLKASTERSMVVSAAAINLLQNLESLKSAAATHLFHGDAWDNGLGQIILGTMAVAIPTKLC